MPPETAPILGQGAPAPEAAPAPPAPASSAILTPAAPPAPATTAIPWLPGADEARLGYVQNKGWKEPSEAIESYVNLEKLMGADRAGNTVVLPKPDALKSEVDAFYNRLGRPADPAGYKIDVPEGIGDPEFAKAAAAKMHELGLPKAQGEALAAWFNDRAVTGVTAQKAQTAAEATAGLESLKTEWGAAFQQNVAAAQAARRALGLDDATMDKLDSALGAKGTIALLHRIGAKSGEAEFITGNGNPGFKSVLSPGQAQAKIAEYRQDKNFTSRLMSKDVSANAEWKLLHEQAYPEPS